MLLKLRPPFHVRIGIREDSDPTSFWRKDPSGIRKDSGYKELISSSIISYDGQEGKLILSHRIKGKRKWQNYVGTARYLSR
jgi:hypothetical protein